MPSERSLEATPTWVMAVLCFVLVVVSIIIEETIHFIGSWLKKKRKPALVEALEKIKAELMLLGFISLILTVVQGPISRICIPRSAANSLHPCSRSEEDIEEEEYDDPCIREGKVQFVSEYGIHQLHVFIFVLALSHVIYCVMTLGLGRLKMRKWKAWEDETKTIEYQFYNDPERFRFARDTSFGRRHMSYWSNSPVLLWIVCFFRQFLTSVTKVDYLTLRHGFITAHLAPQSHVVFDFQKYINRSLEDDFKVVVGISPILWLLAVFFLLSNAHGWNSSLWLPFIPLIVLLLVGAKLQMIITKMGTRIQERGDVVKGILVVQPGDDLFWFNRPGLILFLIHFVLFQNAFLLAFFAWSWYEYGLRSCFHRHLQDIIIRISMGVIIQFLCSYVILPLYALVTQMGSTMRSTVFSDKVAMALRSWHHTAKKHTRQGRHQLETTTPFSSRPTTPLHGARLSPVHLLHNYQTHTIDSLHTSPRTSNFDNEGWGVNPSPNASNHPVEDYAGEGKQDGRSQQSRSAEPPWVHGQHEIEIAVTNFSFREK